MGDEDGLADLLFLDFTKGVHCDKMIAWVDKTMQGKSVQQKESNDLLVLVDPTESLVTIKGSWEDWGTTQFRVSDFVAACQAFKGRLERR